MVVVGGRIGALRALCAKQPLHRQEVKAGEHTGTEVHAGWCHLAGTFRSRLPPLWGPRDGRVMK